MRKLVYLSFFLSLAAKAELLRTPYPGARATGMGNALLALPNGSEAFWYNPASLARQKGYHANLIDGILGVDSLDTLNRLGSFILKGDGTNLLRPDTEYVRAAFRPSLIMPYFGLTFFENFNGFVQFNNFTSPTGSVDIYTFNDIGVAAAVGVPLGPYISLGGTVRVFERTGLDATITSAQMVSALGVSSSTIQSAVYTYLEKLAGTGLGIAVDLGALIEVPLPAGYPKWTLAAVMDDVGVTTFKSIGSASPPSRVLSTVHFGSALEYDLGKSAGLKLAADFRNAFTPNVLEWKQINFGAEYKYRALDFRVGASQGYPTAGLGIEFPAQTRIHFSTYAVELGDSLWNNGFRIWLLQCIIGFNPV